MGWIPFDKLPGGTKASPESAYTHMSFRRSSLRGSARHRVNVEEYSVADSADALHSHLLLGHPGASSGLR